MLPTWTTIVKEYYDDMNQKVDLRMIVDYMFEIVPESDRDRKTMAKIISAYAQAQGWNLTNGEYRKRN